MRHWTILSTALAIALTWLAHDRGWLTADESTLRQAAGIIAQISATMLGFLLAVLAILASITGHRLIQKMMQSGHFRVLLRRLLLNSGAFGATMAASLPATLTSVGLDTLTTVSISLFLLSNLLLIDIGWRMWLILTNLTRTVSSSS